MGKVRPKHRESEILKEPQSSEVRKFKEGIVEKVGEQAKMFTPKNIQRADKLNLRSLGDHHFGEGGPAPMSPAVKAILKELQKQHRTSKSPLNRTHQVSVASTAA